MTYGSGGGHVWCDGGGVKGERENEILGFEKNEGV